MEKIILPSITTVLNPDPEKHFDDIEKYGISKIALFLTGANFYNRQRYFLRLEKIKDLTIPFVHARSDMEPEEFEHLYQRFHTRKFNLHPESEYPLKYNLDSFKDRIFIENADDLNKADLEGYAGICLDLSHLEEWRLMDTKKHQKVRHLVEKYSVGVNHVSAIRPERECNEFGFWGYDSHIMRSVKEFDYLKGYPEKYFGEFIAIELINSLPEQLDLISYLNEILKGGSTN